MKEAMTALRDLKDTAPEKGLVSLKRDKKDKKKSTTGLAVPSGEVDDYAYGTRFDLREEELDKLGIKNLPAVGTKMKLMAEVEVVRTSASAGKESSSKEMSLQLLAIKLD